MAHRHLDDRAEQSELARGGDRRVEGVEANPHVQGGCRVQADGGYPQLLRDQVPFADAVLALCVQDDHLAVAEAQLAQDVRLLQGRLAVAGLAEHQPVRGGELLAVELEGVVDVALAGVDLAADDDARVAEAGGRGRQVDRLGLACRGADRESGGLDLSEEEGREGVGEDGQRIPHLSPTFGCRWRTAVCSQTRGGVRGRTTPASDTTCRRTPLSCACPARGPRGCGRRR